MLREGTPSLPPSFSGPYRHLRRKAREAATSQFPGREQLREASPLAQRPRQKGPHRRSGGELLPEGNAPSRRPGLLSLLRDWPRRAYRGTSGEPGGSRCPDSAFRAPGRESGQGRRFQEPAGALVEPRGFPALG